MKGQLSAYYPESWFNEVGRRKILRKLEPKLPDVSGNLFLTFTIDPHLFSDPASAFEIARDKLRKVFFQLRKGTTWEGKPVQLSAPYFVKVEFHANGWAHFHVIFRTRRFLDGKLLRKLWGLGRTDVRRIKDKTFRYLLKYVTKGGELPEWVKSRTRLRIVQASKGFYVTEPQKQKAPDADRPTRRRELRTIGERLERWKRSALLKSEDGQFRLLRLDAPFHELFAQLVYSVALAGRYLGNGRIQINESKELFEWISQNRTWTTAPTSLAS